MQIYRTSNWALLERMLSDPAIEGTGNMRVQYVGIFFIIAEAQRRDYIVTTQFLVDVTRIDKTGILKATKALEVLGFIKRKKILAAHGRGRAWQYVIDLPEDMHNIVLNEILLRHQE